VTVRPQLDWSYDRWNTELARFFFGGSDSGELVAFCADGPTLAILTDAPEAEAVESLEAVVAACVMPDYRFSNIASLAVQWERDGCDGAPPSLPLLALTVLAASLMQREEDVGAHNFYRRFRQLLDPQDDQAGMPGDFGDHIPALWRQLEWWLNDYLEGASGTLVLQNQDDLEHNPYAKNIAHALQQAVFRVSDRRQLYRFFRAIGVDPGEDDAEPSELRRALAVWAGRHQPVTARLARLATDPLFESYSLDLLARLARSWDGQLVEASSGKPEAPIRLWLMTRPLILTLLASRDDRMPATTVVVGPAGPISLVSNGRWFRPMPLLADQAAHALSAGLELSGDDVALSFEPRSVYALRADEDAGGWVDVDRIEFGVLHQILVRADARAEVTSFCERESPGAYLDPAATRALPPGWFLIRDFRLDRRPLAQPPSQLAALIRSGGGARLRLVGGLKLPHLHNTYLVEGAPFLALPEGIENRTFTLRKDGTVGAHNFSATETEFPIGKLRLDSGHYEIEYGPARIDLDLIDGIVETAGEGAGTIATGGIPGVVGMHGSIDQHAPRNERAPGFREFCVLLGPCPTDVAILHSPVWLSDILGGGGLSWINVDAWTDFEPVWRLTRPMEAQATYVAERVGNSAPRLSERGEGWAKLILQARLGDTADDATYALWDEYQEAARTLG
jgi:hypothetical protein